MPRRTMISWLTQPNAVLDNRVVDPSSVDEMKMGRWPLIKDQKDWDLDGAVINDVIGFILHAEFELPDDFPELPETERAVYDERSFEHVCTKRNSEILDIALSALAKELGYLPEFPPLCLASGSSGENSNTLGKPDWAAVPPKAGPGVKHTCLCPGDTKATPNKLIIPVSRNNEKWAWKYLRQGAHYANQRGSRYFWLITPMELIVCRRTTSDFAGYMTPEVKKFPWTPNSNADVHVNVVLFFLLLVAGLGNDVRPSYDDLTEEHKEKLDEMRVAVEVMSMGP